MQRTSAVDAAPDSNTAADAIRGSQPVRRTDARSAPERGGAFACEPVRERERRALLAWLNRGLRDGGERRLEQEFPTALFSPFSRDPAQDLDKHILVRCDGRFASHVLAHTIPVEAAGHRLDLGMIGMVYTDPAFRGRGAARIGLERAIERLKQQGSAIAILWSDLDAFYARLGFHRAGVENFYLLDPERCRRAQTKPSGALKVRSAAASDWPHLERLYAGKLCRHRRAPGDLARLAAAPACEVFVAVCEGTPVAYAAMGRGDDLTGVVHEWAGDAHGLVACLNRFAETRQEITLLEGPVHEPATRSLRSAGARPHPGSFGLMRILDADKLWALLTRDVATLEGMRLAARGPAQGVFVFSTAKREFELSHRDALCLLFGPGLPQTLRLGLEPEEREALQRRLPLPLFIWGFDSI